MLLFLVASARIVWSDHADLVSVNTRLTEANKMLTKERDDWKAKAEITIPASASNNGHKTLIASWRKMIAKISKRYPPGAQYSIDQVQADIQADPDYQTLKPLLSRDAASQVFKGTTFIYGAKIPSVLLILEGEIDRIEREWNLAVAAPKTPIFSTQHTAIQNKLSAFLNEGTGLREEWKKRLLDPSKDLQLLSAASVKSWHARVEAYLKAIPKGNVYVSRFNVSQAGRDYPLGINYNVDDEWNLLLSDLNRLNEFIADTSLGSP
jgi:hypothetical protein